MINVSGWVATRTVATAATLVRRGDGCMAKIEDILVFLRPYPTQSGQRTPPLCRLCTFTHRRASPCDPPSWYRSGPPEHSPHSASLLQLPSSWSYTPTSRQAHAPGFSHWCMVSVTGLWFQSLVYGFRHRFHSLVTGSTHVSQPT